jgi:hypothetical protein
MKDARGHGSNTRGGASAADAANRLRGQTQYPPKGGFRYEGDPPIEYAPSLIEGMKAKLSDDVAAGRMLASGPKSEPAPVHDAMNAKRLSDAQGSMSRLKDTFHAGNGNNRGGEYGRNVKDAFDRHASVVHEITGKRPNIYDR